jgi:hypothetical protein
MSSLRPNRSRTDEAVIETVWGRLDRARAQELLAFWRARRALPEAEARRRLTEVVCLLRAGGEVLGTSSVYPAEIRMIGGRRFWIYRSLLDPAVGDRGPDMIRATFTALQVGFDEAPQAPIGLCVLLGDPEERRRRSEATWPNPPTIYVGYLADGRQVRLAYFKDARISHE